MYAVAKCYLTNYAIY